MSKVLLSFSDIQLCIAIFQVQVLLRCEWLIGNDLLPKGCAVRKLQKCFLKIVSVQSLSFISNVYCHKKRSIKMDLKKKSLLILTSIQLFLTGCRELSVSVSRGSLSPSSISPLSLSLFFCVDRSGIV